MVASNIREYLLRNNVPFYSVAEKVGIPVRTFCNMLNGQRKITAEEYWNICHVLNVPLDFFVVG